MSIGSFPKLDRALSSNCVLPNGIFFYSTTRKQSLFICVASLFLLLLHLIQFLISDMASSSGVCSSGSHDRLCGRFACCSPSMTEGVTWRLRGVMMPLSPLGGKGWEVQWYHTISDTDDRPQTRMMSLSGSVCAVTISETTSGGPQTVQVAPSDQKASIGTGCSSCCTCAAFFFSW